MSDHDCGVPEQLHYWQVVAQQLPLPQLDEMYDDAFTGLAEALNDFNEIHQGTSPDPDALGEAARKALGRAAVAAIFALGMHMRLHQHAALN